MLIQIYLIDEDGKYIGNDILRENETRKHTLVRPPQPCWKVIWSGEKWIETATEEEKEYKILPQEPTLEEQIKELQSVNQQQDELINISLLATDEMYMMIEPLLVQNYNIGGNNKMVDMYVAMVQRGLKKIEDVPVRYREQVIEILNKLED